MGPSSLTASKAAFMPARMSSRDGAGCVDHVCGSSSVIGHLETAEREVTRATRPSFRLCGP